MKILICNGFISKVHLIQVDIFDNKMKFVQLQGLDQMLTAKNEILKVRLSFYLYNNHNTIYLHQLYISLKTSSIEFGQRLATSDKFLLHVNNELPTDWIAIGYNNFFDSPRFITQECDKYSLLSTWSRFYRSHFHSSRDKK